MEKQWYKEMAVYQIWPRSFCDGNGDGIGDLWGVLSKLDYIKSLNVDAIWFSPIYPSPNADYGYDISDYKSIHPDLGDLELFRQVLDGAHQRGLKVFMDLVINHSSDEHPWFKSSRSSKDSPYHDYYIWRSPKYGRRGQRRPPNNWTSMFEGCAWEYVQDIDEYYLHLFAKKQPDLNLSNPQVRREIRDILRFWLDLGVDGFREDAITFTGKAPGLPDSWPALPIANGIKYFADQPQVYDYLKEFRDEVLKDYDCFTVGEGAMTTPEIALRYITQGPDQVLQEMISFQHMEADCFMTDMIQRPFSLKKLKSAFSRWQYELEGKAWNALYIENHDHARVISRYGSEGYWQESGKMLAAMYILQKGTPFVYQGQEIGMTNIALQDPEQYKDVQSRNNYRLFSKLLGKKKALELLSRSSRENARTPVQWGPGPNAGFSTAEPWFFVNPNYETINVQAQEEDPQSILNFYRSLLAYRKSSPLVLYGSYKELMEESPSFYAYRRDLEGESLLVVCHFSDKPHEFQAPAELPLTKGELIFANYPAQALNGNGFIARPYELRVYHWGKGGSPSL